MKRYWLAPLLLSLLLHLPAFSEPPQWEYGHYEAKYCHTDCLPVEDGFTHEWTTGTERIKNTNLDNLLARGGVDISERQMYQIMNFFGSQGWELVTETYHSAQGRGSQWGFTMKRQKNGAFQTQ